MTYINLIENKSGECDIEFVKIIETFCEGLNIISVQFIADSDGALKKCIVVYD